MTISPLDGSGTAGASGALLGASTTPSSTVPSSTIPTTSTSPSDPTSPTSSTTSSGSSNSTVSNAELNQLSNPQLFLQLLIAELQNQDPTSPMDPSTILQQTSELSQMEAMTTMSTTINSDVSASQANEATGLIGKQVTATVSGAPVSGVVSAINLSASGAPELTISGSSSPIALTDITQVSAPTTTTTDPTDSSSS